MKVLGTWQQEVFARFKAEDSLWRSGRSFEFDSAVGRVKFRSEKIGERFDDRRG